MKNNLLQLWWEEQYPQAGVADINNLPNESFNLNMAKQFEKWVLEVVLRPLKQSQLSEPQQKQQKLKKELQALKNRSDIIELLEKYSLFFEEQGYTDVDWRAEEPYAIDEFMKTL